MTTASPQRARSAVARCVLVTAFSVVVSGSSCWAADWSRFRGEQGTGLYGGKAVPVRWSDSENLQWKVKLPGAGVSSPIVIGERVFVTCFSGYGESVEAPGEMEDLRRHLVCLQRADGKILWSKTVEPVLPEDPFAGIGLPRHGYASSTPVSDGRHVYVFFGKTGVIAFDLDGNQLWQTSVGTSSGGSRWGSAASPILYGDKIIVNASDESRSIVALSKQTGEEVWRAEAELLESIWATPIILEGPNGPELIIAVPGEVWGLNPDTGKLKWYAEVIDGARGVCASLVFDDDVIYCIGGNPSGNSCAVRIGGKGDVTDSHVLWKQRGVGRISSPIFYQRHLYGASRGVAYCVDGKTGERRYLVRLESGEAVLDEAADEHSHRRSQGRDRGSESRSGQSRASKSRRGGTFGPADYGSAILAGGNVYATTTTGTVYVFAAKPQFELIAANKLSDGGLFNATPAISDGQLFIRSSTHLYCIAEAD